MKEVACFNIVCTLFSNLAAILKIFVDKGKHTVGPMLTKINVNPRFYLETAILYVFSTKN